MTKPWRNIHLVLRKAIDLKNRFCIHMYILEVVYLVTSCPRSQSCLSPTDKELPRDHICGSVDFSVKSLYAQIRFWWDITIECRSIRMLGQDSTGYAYMSDNNREVGRVLPRRFCSLLIVLAVAFYVPVLYTSVNYSSTTFYFSRVRPSHSRSLHISSMNI